MNKKKIDWELYIDWIRLIGVLTMLGFCFYFWWFVISNLIKYL